VTGAADPAVAFPLLRLLRGAPLLILLAVGTGPPAKGPAAGPLVGGEFLYTARRGDSLALVGARFGVDAGRLARDTGLSPTARLSVGQRLQVENRHAVPGVVREGVVINVPQRLLFFFREGALEAWYPIAAGRRDWQTPTGLFEVASKRHRPHVARAAFDPAGNAPEGPDGP
jgi:L,D-transpeptidase ErfK/SrfK